MKQLLVLFLFGVAFFAIWLLPDALYLTILGPGAVFSAVATKMILSLIAFGACLAGLWLVSIPSGGVHRIR